MTATFREVFVSAQDGRRLYCRDYDGAGPSAPILLCLPGLSRNSKDFAWFAERHAKTHRIIVPDYRGRGRSDRGPDWRAYHPKVALDDLRHQLTALGVHRFIAVGTSYGGILAMGLGVVMPSAIQGAVLNDVGPVVEDAALGPLLDYIAAAAPVVDWDAAIKTLKTIAPHLTLADDANWRAFAEATYVASEDGRGLVCDWDPAILRPVRGPDSETPDVWPLFRSLRRIPVLSVRGEISGVLRDTTVERMAVEHPDFTRITVTGCGHAPSLIEPECTDALNTFLSRWR